MNFGMICVEIRCWTFFHSMSSQSFHGKRFANPVSLFEKGLPEWKPDAWSTLVKTNCYACWHLIVFIFLSTCAVKIHYERVQPEATECNGVWSKLNSALPTTVRTNAEHLRMHRGCVCVSHLCIKALCVRTSSIRAEYSFASSWVLPSLSIIRSRLVVLYVSLVGLSAACIRLFSAVTWTQAAMALDKMEIMETKSGIHNTSRKNWWMFGLQACQNSCVCVQLKHQHILCRRNTGCCGESLQTPREATPWAESTISRSKRPQYTCSSSHDNINRRSAWIPVPLSPVLCMTTPEDCLWQVCIQCSQSLLASTWTFNWWVKL